MGVLRQGFKHGVQKTKKLWVSEYNTHKSYQAQREWLQIQLPQAPTSKKQAQTFFGAGSGITTPSTPASPTPINTNTKSPSDYVRLDRGDVEEEVSVPWARIFFTLDCLSGGSRTVGSRRDHPCSSWISDSDTKNLTRCCPYGPCTPQWKSTIMIYISIPSMIIKLSTTQRIFWHKMIPSKIFFPYIPIFAMTAVEVYMFISVSQQLSP